MTLNFVVFIAIASVVKGSVIVNVFDGNLHLEGGSKPKANSLDDCNYQACDQLCRRFGFPGGACVGDRCQCDNFEPSPKESNLRLEAGSKAKANSLDDCNYQACNQLCRRLGFPGGACVGDRCQCDNFEPSPKESNLHLEVGSNAKSNSLDDCNYQECDQLCRRFGFSGGACVGDKCQCYNLEPSPKESNLRLEASSKAKANSLDACNYQACDQLCRRLGFPGGACVGDKCQCDNFEPSPKKSSELFAEPAVYKKHDSGYNKKLISLKDVPQKTTNNVKEDCDFFSCYLWCTSLNYIGGSCIGDWCLCY